MSMHTTHTQIPQLVFIVKFRVTLVNIFHSVMLLYKGKSNKKKVPTMLRVILEMWSTTICNKEWNNMELDPRLQGLSSLLLLLKSATGWEFDLIWPSSNHLQCVSLLAVMLFTMNCCFLQHRFWIMWYPGESYQQSIENRCEGYHSCQQQCWVSVYVYVRGGEETYTTHPLHTYRCLHLYVCLNSVLYSMVVLDFVTNSTGSLTRKYPSCFYSSLFIYSWLWLN